MSAKNSISNYDVNIFRELRCDKLLVAGREVRGGAPAQEKAAAPVPEGKGSSLLVQRESVCPVAQRLRETAAPGSVLVFDGRELTVATPGEYADPTGNILVHRPDGQTLFVPGSELGLYCYDPDLVSTLEKQLADALSRIEKLEKACAEAKPVEPATKPKRTYTKRASKAAVKKGEEEKKEAAEKIE